MTTPLIAVCANTSVGIALLMLGAWLVSLPLRNAAIADMVWGGGFVLVACLPKK